MSGSGISWTTCKSAPRTRQITMSAPHNSVFTGQMHFLQPNQQRQSTEGKSSTVAVTLIIRQCNTIFQRLTGAVNDEAWHYWGGAGCCTLCRATPCGLWKALMLLLGQHFGVYAMRCRWHKRRLTFWGRFRSRLNAMTPSFCRCDGHWLIVVSEWVSSFVTAHKHIIGHFSAITS